jgi:hypothetical protein
MLALRVLHWFVVSRSDGAHLGLRAARGQPALARERVVRDDLLDCMHVNAARAVCVRADAPFMMAVVVGGPWVKPAVRGSVRVRNEAAGTRTDGRRSTLQSMG